MRRVVAVKMVFESSDAVTRACEIDEGVSKRSGGVVSDEIYSLVGLLEELGQAYHACVHFLPPSTASSTMKTSSLGIGKTCSWSWCCT